LIASQSDAPVRCSELEPSFIRQRLAGTSLPLDLVNEALARVDGALLAAWFRQPFRPAAVLVPLCAREGSMHVLLTERTHSVRDHPGQVAFPGGMVEPDDRDLVATALREANEEIGIQASQVEVIGYLLPQAVITGYAVLPVVGFYTADFVPRLDPREVAGVFEVPLSYLQDSTNLVRVDRMRNGVKLPTYEYHFEGHRIWGATALMLRLFLDLLR
jgi:8-oxo-dGTP pyrophosphatase MutT (NUDIX family)